MNTDCQPAKNRKLLLSVIVVAIILIVATSVYIMTRPPHVPEIELVPSILIHGEGFLIRTDASTPWDDLTIQLRSPSNTTVSWAILTSRLDAGTTCNYTDGPKALDSLNISCNITDLAGNGCADQMDGFTLMPEPDQAFVAGALYTVTVIYEPTATDICVVTFEG